MAMIVRDHAMSETERVVPSASSATPTSSLVAARSRTESRGWLALIFQVLGLAGATAGGFAVSHYITTQQQQSAAERQMNAVPASSSAATAAVPPEGAPAATSPPAEALRAAEPFDAKRSTEPPLRTADPRRPFSKEIERAMLFEAEETSPSLQRSPPLDLNPVPLEDSQESTESTIPNAAGPESEATESEPADLQELPQR